MELNRGLILLAAGPGCWGSLDRSSLLSVSAEELATEREVWSGVAGAPVADCCDPMDMSARDSEER